MRGALFFFIAVEVIAAARMAKWPLRGVASRWRAGSAARAEKLATCIEKRHAIWLRGGHSSG
jgi:hypothetical protein